MKRECQARCPKIQSKAAEIYQNEKGGNGTYTDHAGRFELAMLLRASDACRTEGPYQNETQPVHGDLGTTAVIETFACALASEPALPEVAD